MRSPPDLLLVACSARMLAAASLRAGRHPLALDLFADADTRELADCVRIAGAGDGLRFDRAALLAAAGRPDRRDLPLIVGTGFENDPDLLAELAQGRRLIGNAPETVRRVKDPVVFAATLGRLGVPHPPVADRHPGEGEWLVKRVGGSGGTHIRDARAGEAAEPGAYVQRVQAGEPVSLLFLADGAGIRPIGFSAQWSDPAPGAPFRYGGAVGPLELPTSLAERLAGWAAQVADAFGLRGLNAADFLVDGDDAWLLEVNPRPSATLDLFDRDPLPPLLALHAEACESLSRDGRGWPEGPGEGVLSSPSSLRGEGRGEGAAGGPESSANAEPPHPNPLPGGKRGFKEWGRGWAPTPPSFPTARAVGILYADQPMAVPAGLRWATWVTDRPDPGPVEAGMPVCGVVADGPSCADARLSLSRRMDGLRARLAATPIVQARIFQTETA